jgi:hypothetical protein
MAHSMSLVILFHLGYVLCALAAVALLWHLQGSSESRRCWPRPATWLAVILLTPGFLLVNGAMAPSFALLGLCFRVLAAEGRWDLDLVRDLFLIAAPMVLLFAGLIAWRCWRKHSALPSAPADKASE